CNPGTLNKEKLKTYKKLGINRLSFGLQSAFDEELKTLGRIHTFRDFMDNMEEARALGFDNINVDLMSAIPGQTLASWKRTLAQIAMTAPEHISAYSLIVEPGTPFYEAYGEGDVTAGHGASAGNAGLAANVPAPAFCALNNAPADPETLAYLKSLKLPGEETERQMYYDTLAVLESAGYYRYEISNYSKPGYECMHNIGYWTGENYLGMGLGAASMVDGIRWKNTEDMAAYMGHDFGGDRYDTAAAVLEGKASEEADAEAVAAGLASAEAPAGQNSPIHIDIEKLSHADKMAEYIILGLRLTRGFSMEQFMDRFGVSFMFKFGDIVRELDEKDLIKVTQTEYTDPVTGKDSVDTRVALTARGIDVSNTVMAEFMP
ncbi:MAG: radical SAM protein, partial [Parasporobacterium sp.]|nr:radical SAM protein [Parasporobacterium sp.]